MKKKIGNTSVLLLMLIMLLAICGSAFAAPAATQEAKSSFKDVSSTDANAAYINFVAGKDLIKGFPDGGYHPQEGLTRAQAATLLAKTAGITTSKTTNQFKDVPAGHWAAGYIAAASEAGYIKGYPDGKFLPEKKLTRAEGISLFMRLSKQNADAALPVLQDMNSKHWTSASVATALAAGMILPSQDGNSFYPDQDFMRGDLARALAVLLTKEPDLSKASLVASLKVKSGDVFLTKALSTKEDKITGTIAMNIGDTVKTGANGEAELGFADGTGLLLKNNTTLVLKEGQGRSYIKKNGNPGVSVDLLEVELKQGKLFGALASNSGTVSTPVQQDQKKTSFITNKLASLKDAAALLFAAADKADPWYKTAENKKVKVKVDMPWGVAAIRGSFWNNFVDAKSNSTVLLEGVAEVTAGGQTVSLPPGQSSNVGSAGSAPSAPAPMSAAQKSEWQQNKDWVQEKVQAIEANQQIAAQNAPISTTVSEAVNKAMSDTGVNNASQNTSTSSSSSSSSSNSSYYSQTAGSWGLTDITSVVYDNQSVLLTQDFWMTAPAGVAATKYELWGKYNLSNWNEISSKGINERTRHLAKVFSQPENLVVKLFGSSSSYYTLGTYSLAVDGGQKILQDVATQTVSGAVYLPGTTTAGSGGIPLRLSLNGSSSDGYYYNTYTDLTIPEGSSSVAYSIKAPKGSSYNVSCSAKSTNTYTGQAYRGNSISYIDLTTSDVSDKNITLVEARWVTGTLSFPKAINQSVSVNICTDNGSGGYRTTTSENLSATNTSASYRVSALANNITRVYYEISDSSFLNNNEFVDVGYYGSGGTMVSDPLSAQLFPAGSTDLTANLTVIEGGPWLKGTISLPGGAVAEKDLTIGVGALNPSNISQSPQNVNVTIPKDSASATFAIRLTKGSSYKLGYNIYDGDYCKAKGYVQSGLYKSVTETVYAASGATIITIPADGVTGVADKNLTVLDTGGKVVEGTITLPSGLSGAYWLQIKATNQGTGKEFCVTELSATGSTSVPYSMVLPDGCYFITAYLFSGTGYYLNPNSYTAYGSITAPITLTSNTQNVDITINGSVSGGGGSAISPSCIGPHSVLIANVAVNVNNSYYRTDFLTHFGMCSKLYYKDANSVWYDLVNQTAGSLTNPVNESSLPTINYNYN